MSDSQKDKTLFFISPIGDKNSKERIRSDNLKKLLIIPAIEEFNYKCIRADELAQSGRIDTQVIDLVIKSDLVIADLSDHNPNVFYELAVRHAFQKPVILIIEEGQNIPFDVKTHRTIYYNLQNVPQFEDAKKQLIEQIKAINEQNFITYSPIKEVLSTENYSNDNMYKEILSIVSNNSHILYELLNTNKQNLNNNAKMTDELSISIHKDINRIKQDIEAITMIMDQDYVHKLELSLSEIEMNILNILKENQNFTSIEEIAEKTRLSSRSVMRYISKFYVNGLIEKDQKRNRWKISRIGILFYNKNM